MGLTKQSTKGSERAPWRGVGSIRARNRPWQSTERNFLGTYFAVPMRCYLSLTTITDLSLSFVSHLTARNPPSPDREAHIPPPLPHKSPQPLSPSTKFQCYCWRYQVRRTGHFTSSPWWEFSPIQPDPIKTKHRPIELKK